MNGMIFALVVLLLSIGATYFFCIRLMRKGNCVMGQGVCGADAQGASRDAQAEGARLKTEIAALSKQASRSASE